MLFWEGEMDFTIFNRELLCTINCLDQHALIGLIGAGVALGQFAHERKTAIENAEYINNLKKSLLSENSSVFHSDKNTVRSKLTRIANILELYQFLEVISLFYFIAGFIFLLAHLSTFFNLNAPNKNLLLNISFLITFFSYSTIILYLLICSLKKPKNSVNSILSIIERKLFGYIKFKLLLIFDRICDTLIILSNKNIIYIKKIKSKINLK
jgi:hypothetical protein